MDYRFSKPFASMPQGGGGDVLKMTADPATIPFAAGNPSAETFPLKELRAIADELFQREDAPALFQYGQTEGYDPLRDFLRQRMAQKHGTGRPEDELMITGGGQQAIDLFTRMMIDPGDVILAEDPTFMGALKTFAFDGARVVGVPMEPDGMDLNALEDQLRQQKNVKFIYVITTFQNPTGYTTSMEKRREIYALAQRYDVMILEDNPYFELRYSGEYVPPLKSLDEDGRVFFAGSLSKILSPGVRMGYAQANRQLIERMAQSRMASDIHCNLFFQAVAAEYFNRFDLDAHIAACCQLYRSKRDLMLEELAAHMPDGVALSRPDGGLFIWLALPQGSNSDQLAALAAQNGVAVVPGSAFVPGGCRENPGVRLNYSTPTEEQIRRGVAILAQCTRQVMGK